MDAEDLYRLAPEDFTAARDAAAKRARTDGDRGAAAALKALRRPSLSAWLLNTLVRQDAQLVTQLLQLGPGLAQAQAGGDAAALRALGEQRRQLVGAVVARAVGAADRPVTAAVRDEVASTLEAALADPASADAVRSGRLVRALSYAGFGEVDLAGAVAPSTRAPSSTAPSSTAPSTTAADDPSAAVLVEQPDKVAQRLAQAEAAALEAAGRLDDAVRACRDAERHHEAAARVEQDRAAQVERLTEQLADARAQHDTAAAAAEAAAKAARKAASKVERAQDRAELARDALDALRRTD